MTEASPAGQIPEALVQFNRGEGIYVTSLFVAAFRTQQGDVMATIQKAFTGFGVPSHKPERDRLWEAAKGLQRHFAELPLEPNSPEVDIDNEDPKLRPMGRVRTAIESDSALAQLFFGEQRLDRRQQTHVQLGQIASHLRRVVRENDEREAAKLAKTAVTPVMEREISLDELKPEDLL